MSVLTPFQVYRPLDIEFSHTIFSNNAESIFYKGKPITNERIGYSYKLILTAHFHLNNYFVNFFSLILIGCYTITQVEI